MWKKFINWIKGLFGDNDTPAGSEFPENVIWLGLNVSGWAKTSKCTPTVSGNKVTMEHDKKQIWPKAGNVDGGVCNANCWIIFTYNAKDYAATWEWLKVGQSVKVLTGKLGTYIKKNPPIPSSWHPKSGERVGLFVSGLCRDSARNVSERSNVTWINWP